jgi:hypothetical protein
MKHSVPIFLCIVSLAAGASAQTIYFSDLEANDGGWVAGDDWAAAEPEWEWGTPQSVGPPSAYSGVNVWATKLMTNHSDSGGNSWITQTFDFTDWTNVQLTFYSWIDSGSNSFDQATVQVNGTVLYLDDGSSGGLWEQVVVDLSAYDNVASVEIRFNFFATTVVNRAGWYVDDVDISGVLVPVELQSFTIE